LSASISTILDFPLAEVIGANCSIGITKASSGVSQGLGYPVMFSFLELVFVDESFEDYFSDNFL
jgi:hypothetical protein